METVKPYCQGLGWVSEEEGMNRAQRIFRAGKYSVFYYTDEYMCPSPGKTPRVNQS